MDGQLRGLARDPRFAYSLALASVGAVTMAIAVLNVEVRIANIAMLYLVAVIATAVYFGAGPAIAASITAFLAFDFFFTEPRYTFTVSDPSEWVALLLFLFTATITGQLAARQRLRANEAEQREHEAALLYDIARLMNGPDAKAAINAVAERLRSEIGLAAVGIEIETEGLANMKVEAGRREALRFVHTGSQSAFRLLHEGPTPTADTRGIPGRWVRGVPPRGIVVSRTTNYEPEIVPIRSGERRLGTLVVVREHEGRRPNAVADRLLSAVVAMIAASVERERLREEATEAETLRRTDELKTALLNAVSHDLRSPLASIIASAGSLRQTDVAWSEDEREDFAEAIEQEARRLDRLVGHLLDLSRIESGSLRPSKHWYDLAALIDEVVGRLQPMLSGHKLTVEVDDELPPVPLDYVEIDEVLTNLLENATKYTPLGSEIRVSAHQRGQEIEVAIADSGPGIPEEARATIFEPFVRLSSSKARGTGLGLAVARGLVEAHSGRLQVSNRPVAGAVFCFTLPLSDGVEAAQGAST